MCYTSYFVFAICRVDINLNQWCWVAKNNTRTLWTNRLADESVPKLLPEILRSIMLMSAFPTRGGVLHKTNSRCWFIFKLPKWWRVQILHFPLWFSIMADLRRVVWSRSSDAKTCCPALESCGKFRGSMLILANLFLRESRESTCINVLLPL